MIAIEQLGKDFRKRTVLDNLNFRFENKTYGLLGPNGAGKTTLMRCITNLYRPDRGRVTWEGQPIANNRAYLSGLSYLPQKFGVYKELTLREMLRYFGDMKKVDKAILDDKISEALVSVNLAERADDKAKSLSGGMVRRLGIAQTLLNDPRVLILDEPTAGLDPEERKRFKELIAKISEDRTIILSTHIVEDVEKVCDKIIIMNTGKFLFTGSVEDICKNNESLEEGFLWVLYGGRKKI
jgi:ABC-2 type transport system ATP-binding protein